MSMGTQALLIFLLIGLVAGFLASLVVGGGGLIRCLLSGIIGAFVGGHRQCDLYPRRDLCRQRLAGLPCDGFHRLLYLAISGKTRQTLTKEAVSAV